MSSDIANQMTLLQKIHDIDINFVECNHRLEEISDRLSTVNTECDTLKREIETLATKQKEIEATKRSAEGEIEAKRAWVKEKETKLTLIKTNKEYQAASKEIADGKRLIKEMEETVLKYMESLDKINEETKQLIERLADKEGESKTTVDAIIEDQKIWQQKKKDLTKAQETIFGGLDSDVLARYQRIQMSHIDAVSILESGICSGCSMRVEPQLVIELRRCKSLVQCRKCSRILTLPTSEKSGETATAAQ